MTLLTLLVLLLLVRRCNEGDRCGSTGLDEADEKSGGDEDQELVRVNLSSDGSSIFCCGAL